MKPIIFGPCYREEEINNLKKLSSFIRSKGINAEYLTLEAEIIKAIKNSNLNDNEIRILTNILLATDIYYMLNKAECSIGILNGRVPDESTVTRLGIAYALGVPILLYKYDSRIAFVSGDNSMILGLSEHKVISNPEELVRMIRKLKKERRNNNRQLPEYIKLLCQLGEDVYAVYKDNRSRDNFLEYLYHHYKDNDILLNLNTYKKNYQSLKGKVYCSGPLFSPDEQREMEIISTKLEKCGFQTFLPHRDGAEPYILNSVNNPFAGSFVAKPVIHLINKVIFSIDVAEIIRCDSLIINLNGRGYDEGAMAELGMSFAFGKPIVITKTDSRDMIKDCIHPYVWALAYWNDIICDYRDLEKFRYSEAIKNENASLNEFVSKTQENGIKFMKVLNKIKKPDNRMLNWLKD